MTQTLERNYQLPSVERTAGPMTLEEIVDHSLSRVERMDEYDNPRKLESLVLCGKRLDLLTYVKSGQREHVIEDVPAIAELCQKIHDTADSLLEDAQLDNDSMTVMVNLGTASDMVGDPALLERTLKAIEHMQDKTDVHVDQVVRALKVAYDDGRLFSEVYGRLKAGKKVYENANEFVPMAQWPDFPENDPHAFLSKPISIEGKPYRPRHRADVPVDSDGTPITTEQAIHGIQKDPKTGLFGDGYSG